MWQWLDPIECRIAEQYLAHGQMLEAARHLLEGSNPKHKSVREMLLRIGPVLVDQARQAAESGDVVVAGELIAWAGRCGDLGPEAQSLKREIEAAADEQAKNAQWQQARLQAADTWARDGRLQSALGLIEPLGDDDPETARRKQDWAAVVARLERYAREFHDYLSQEQYAAAEAVLRKAQSAAPGQPQTLSMEQALAAKWLGLPAPASDSAPVLGQDAPATAPATASSYLLSGLPAYGDILILRQPTILIGTPGEPYVDLPIQAMLHRRHALLVREEAPDRTTRYRLLPLAGCAVAVNGVRIPDGSAAILNDANTIQLGSDQCRWSFRVRGSTAVLEQARPATACAVSPAGSQIRCIVLAEKEIIVGRQRDRADLVYRHLPVEELCLQWRADGWHTRIVGGEPYVNGVEADRVQGRLALPARFTLLPRCDDEAMGKAFGGSLGFCEVNLWLRAVGVP